MQCLSLKNFQFKDGLPDPKGTLSASVPSRAIVGTNREVEAELARIKETSVSLPQSSLISSLQMGTYTVHSLVSSPHTRLSSKAASHL